MKLLPLLLMFVASLVLAEPVHPTEATKSESGLTTTEDSHFVQKADVSGIKTDGKADISEKQAIKPGNLRKADTVLEKATVSGIKQDSGTKQADIFNTDKAGGDGVGAGTDANRDNKTIAKEAVKGNIPVAGTIAVSGTTKQAPAISPPAAIVAGKTARPATEERHNGKSQKAALPDKQIVVTASPSAEACIPLGMTKNILTPPDLFKRVSACIAQENYDEAARLYALAGIYSIFDAQRIADKRAVRERKVLIASTFSAISSDRKTRFAEAQKRLGRNPASRVKLCNDVKRIGMPGYFPNYLITYNRSTPANTGSQQMLMRNFNPEKEWKTLRTLYLGCQA